MSNPYRYKPMGSEPVASSSSNITPIKRESSNDLRKLLALIKERSPKKNGFKPQPYNVTHPKPKYLSKDASRSNLKYDTNSSLYNKPSSSPPLPPLSSSPEEHDPEMEDASDWIRTCSTKTCNNTFRFSHYKRCEKCRAKEARKMERRKERNLAAKRLEELLQQRWDALPLEERFAGYMQQLRNKGILSSRSANTVAASSSKRKADEDWALEQSLLKKQKLSGDVQEYQRAEDLYDALECAREPLGFLYSFTGNFSVISPSTAVVNSERVKVEARRLIKTTGITTR